MKRTFFLLIVTIISVSVFAQKQVALHSNGTTSIFASQTAFIDAYTAAQNGDTIYLPGGVFDAPGYIEKQLTILGAGYNPDSTQATYQTKINGNFSFTENAAGSFIQGIYFIGTVSVSSNHPFSNSTIQRCYFNSQFNVDGGTNYTQNLTLVENVFMSTCIFRNVNNSLFSNNIFLDNIRYTNSIEISNCIFLRGPYSYTDYGVIRDGNGTTVKDCIFIKPSGQMFSGCSNFTLDYCLFAFSPSIPASFITNSNYESVDISTLFINQTDYTFDFTQDYHLVDPVSYPGTTGYPIGIYFGLFPFKDGGIPMNPHIITKSVDSSTDTDGNLNVNFQVGAQQN